MIIEMKNSEIVEVINETYKSEKNRAILKDRIFNGMSYYSLVNKYFDGDKLPERIHRNIQEQISRMFIKTLENAKKRCI